MLSQGAASSVPTEAKELNSLFYGPLNDEWCSGLHIMCTATKIKVKTESLIVSPGMYFFYFHIIYEYRSTGFVTAMPRPS